MPKILGYIAAIIGGAALYAFGYKLGGYLWRGEVKIYDNEHIIGHYFPKEENIISKDSMYFLLNRVGNFMTGKWVGCNYDYDFTWEFGVIAKDKDFAVEKIQKLLNIKMGMNNTLLNKRGKT